MDKTLIERDLAHLWHPCSQMKDYEKFPPIVINKAYGCYLETDQGEKIIDAISSWWCKSLGHAHPRLQQALRAQMETLEHVILANTTNNTIVQLSEKLSALTQTLNKVMYASDGSCAVEMALKMSLHVRQILGQKQKSEFIALSNGYHGETLLALATSDLGIYAAPYKHICPSVHFLQNIPYVSGDDDPLWHDCSTVWPSIEAQLLPHVATTTALILEPLVQGAGGMKIYSQDFLRRLRHFTQAHDIYLVADEILTGLGRTGRNLACEYADMEPDFLCLAKGLTAGMLPMSATLTSDTIYEIFYDDYATGKSFLHSHTHTGNALAAAVAIATLETLADESINQTVTETGPYLRQAMQAVADATGKLQNIRPLGFVVAADLKTEKPRAGYEVYQQAVKLGALCRPLGNTVYWMPPLNTPKTVIDELQVITSRAIAACEG